MKSKVIMIHLNEKIPGCENFYWYEVLWLDGVGACAIPQEVEVFENLEKITQKLQKIRQMFNSPITVTSGWRPEKYNVHIGGAKYSQHILGKALDFKIKNYDCDHVRNKILPHLEELNIRMEDKKGSNWVHIDFKEVKHGMNRYFKP